MLQVLEHDGARDLVDLRARGGEDHAEGFFLGAGRLDGDGRAEVDLVAFPLVDLRLVDEHRRAGDAEVARPRVRRQLGRRGRSRGSSLREHRGRGAEEGGRGKSDGSDDERTFHDDSNREIASLNDQLYAARAASIGPRPGPRHTRCADGKSHSGAAGPASESRCARRRRSSPTRPRGRSRDRSRAGRSRRRRPCTRRARRRRSADS